MKNFLFSVLLILFSCSTGPRDDVADILKLPDIIPDYSDIIIPPNIAPLNFIIKEEGTAFCVRFSRQSKKIFELNSKNGKIRIPIKKWKKLLENSIGKEINITVFRKDKQKQWSQFKPMVIKIAVEPIDPYLSYRLLYPGFEAYTDLSIKQRCIENFKEHSLIENSIIDHNCINCHTFNPDNSSEFLFHVRGSYGGTYFYKDKKLKKHNLKKPDLENNAVYPRWHPSGKFIAFSCNKTGQLFHASETKKIEVIDMASSLILYDIDQNQVLQIELPDKDKFMDTYPEWSPDGKFLYFCRAGQPASELEYKQIKYDLYRLPFNSKTRIFGSVELIFDANRLDKSVSFPRISPNGKFLIFTLHDYGCFSIWHKNADLYSINLETSEVIKLNLNSDFAESYHSWSSNSKWLVFSSKRGDGLTARPYISYIHDNGESSNFTYLKKILNFMIYFLKLLNSGINNTKIVLTPGRIRNTAKSEVFQAY